MRSTGRAGPPLPAAAPRPVLLAVTVAWAAVLVLWSVLAPPFRAPDEPFHLDLVLHLADGGGYPPPGKLLVDDDVRAAFPLGGLADASATSLATQRAPLPVGPDGPGEADRPFDGLADVPPDGRLVDQMTQHPPLYYGLAGAATHVLPGFASWGWADQLLALRLLSAMLVLPLPAIAAALARRAGAAPPVQTCAALLVLAVPQAAHVGASVTNDGLLALLGAGTLVAAASLARGDLRLRTAAAGGVLGGLALFTKAFAVGAVGALLLALLVSLLRADGRRRWFVVVQGLLTGALLLACGGWWFVVNLLRYGTPQPDGLALPPPPPAGFEPDVLRFARVFTTSLARSSWGSFGWLEVPLPTSFLVLGTAVVLVAVTFALGVALVRRLLSLRHASGRRQVLVLGPSGAVRLLLGAAAVLQVAVVTQQAWKNYARSDQFAGIQGRYLLAVGTALAVLVAVGLVEGLRLLGEREPRRLVPVLAACVVAAQGVGAVTALDGFWAPSHDAREGGPSGLDVLLTWSRLPDRLLVVALAVGLAALAGVAVAHVRDGGASRGRHRA